MWLYWISKVAPGTTNFRTRRKATTVSDVAVAQLLVRITGHENGRADVVKLDWNARWKRLRLIDSKGGHHDLRWKENE